MEFKIKDRLANTIDLAVIEVREKGIVTRTESKQEYCNAYGFAHGGFVYTVGHISAVLSAQIKLGRKCIVSDASCEYLTSLKVSPAIAETELLRAGNSTLVYRVTVFDGNHKACFQQMVTLRDTHAEETEVHGRTQSIFPSQPGDPVDEVTGIAYPKASPAFGTTCHCYMSGRGASGLRYSCDLLDDVCNSYGAGHGGAIYTCCDACAGGSMAMLLEKRPVTVASTIHYLQPAINGPVTVEAKLLRQGKQLVFYDLDITDANGQLVAAAQFTMQGVDYKATNLSQNYQNKAFKE